MDWCRSLKYVIFKIARNLYNYKNLFNKNTHIIVLFCSHYTIKITMFLFTYSQYIGVPITKITFLHYNSILPNINIYNVIFARKRHICFIQIRIILHFKSQLAIMMTIVKTISVGILIINPYTATNYNPTFIHNIHTCNIIRCEKTLYIY